MHSLKSTHGSTQAEKARLSHMLCFMFSDHTQQLVAVEAYSPISLAALSSAWRLCMAVSRQAA